MAISDLLSAKTVRFITVTILLGAIGSGAWEWVLKPALTSVSEFGLNVATLGIKSFKDSLYKKIALGFHEESSVKLYVAVFGFLPAFILGILTGFFRGRNRSNEPGAPNTFDKVMGKLIRPFLIFVIFILTFSVVQANQMAYVSRSITHFHVLLQIASPYISENQRLLYQSQFAQISSKENYAKIVDELTAICHAKNLKTPEFSIW
jgi:ABC-type nitrate/sulfonate/bicarbonate transport system permease component